ncbi:hypothetical protein AeMF1_012179 [Aphanomyces euteiches]|nr:hypothetical protein AeMF1_012179 [Aphanomyces euteiches]KAH9192642.1 hypothetical protein AeNC1_005385 [Aphanomyces euteiches]
MVRVKWNGIACVLGLTAVLCNMITMPLRTLVLPTTELLDTPHPILALDYLLDAIMLAVCMVNLVCCRATYLRSSRRRWLWIEGMAFVPLDLAAHGMGFRGNFGLFRLNHILGIVPMLRYLRITEGHFWRMSVQKRRTMYILTILPMCSHWFACIWFYTAYVERFQEFSWDKQAMYPEFYNTTTAVAYLRSIYWSATMLTTVGFGDVTAVTRLETLIAIVVIYMGVFISCASIACVLKLMEHADRNQMALQERLDDVCGYLEWRGASNDLVDRAVAAVHANFVPQIEATQEALETMLPHALRARLQIELEQVLVHTVPRFQTASKTLRAAISEHAIYVSKGPGDVLIHDGQRLDGLYLLRRGEANCVRGADGTVLKLFNELEFIGDEALLRTDELALHSIVCVTACEFVFLARVHFQDMWQVELDRHPDLPVDDDNARRSTSRDGKDHILAVHRHGQPDDDDTASRTNSAQRMQRRRRGCWCCVMSSDWLPNSMFRRLWTLVCFSGLLYNIYAVPRDCAFFRTHNRFEDPDVEAVVDLALFWSLDVVFLVDFFLHCRRFYIEYDGHLITDRRKIFRRYVRSIWFAVDLLSILPLDLGAAWYSMTNLPFLRLNKIVRILHLSEYFQVAEALLLSRFHVHVFARRIVRIVSILVLSGYLVGCFWYYVAEVTVNDYPTANWVAVDQADPNFYFKAYVHNRFYLIRSMYFGYIGGSTLGFGDIVPVNPYETLVATIMLLYGAILKPALVGGVASLLLTRNKTRLTYQKTLVGFQTLVTAAKLPDAIKHSVARYLEFTFEHEYYAKERAILELLPDLRGEILAMLCRSSDESAPLDSSIHDDEWSFFRDVDEDSMRAIYAAMEPQLLLPQDAIDLPDGSLAVLHTGTLFQLNLDGMTVDSVDETLPLHERTIGVDRFLGLPSASTYRAGADFCEILRLQASDVETIVTPAVWTAIRDAMEAHAARNSREHSGKSALFDEPKAAVHTTHKSNHVVPISLADFGLSKGQSMLSMKLETKSRCHPKSRFRRALNVLVGLALLYNAFLVPFRLAFFSSRQPPSYLYGFLVDYVLDVLFIADVVVNYRYRLLRLTTGSAAASWQAHKSICRELKWDIVCAFPIELFVVDFVARHPDLLVGVLTVCRLPKVVRLSYFTKRVKALAQAAIRKWPHAADFVVVCRYLLFILFFSHVLACGWHYLAFADKGIFPWSTECNALDNTVAEATEATQEASCLFAGTWIEFQIHGMYLPPDGGTIWQRYSRCFNFAIQMLLVVSSGVIVPVNMIETFFCIGAIFSGIFFSAGKIGVIGEVALKVDAVSASIRQATDALSKYVAFHDVPQLLQDKALGFMDFLYRHRRTLRFQQDDVVAHLPPQLQDAIVVHCKLARLHQSELFASLPLDVLHAIAVHMKPRWYAPGDVLVHQLHYGRCMYFVKPGCVQFQDVAIATAHSKRLAVFGARSLLLDEPHPRTIVACTFAEAYLLHGLDAVFGQFPELKAQLEAQLEADDDGNVTPLDGDDMDKDDCGGGQQHRLEKMDSDAGLLNRRSTRLTSTESEQDDDLMDNNAIQAWTLPNSRFRRVWDMLLFFTTVYVLVMLPLRAAYLVEDRVGVWHELVAWYTGDVVAVVLYAVDTALSFSCFAYVDHSKLVRDRVKIQENYRAYLWLDVTSIVAPFGLLLACVAAVSRSGDGGGGGSSSWTLVSALKFCMLPMLLRAKRFPRYLRRLTRTFQHASWSRLSGSMMHIVQCILYYLIMVHWWACIWMALHRYIETDSALTWAVRDPYMGGGKLSVYNATTHAHNICTDMVDCYIRKSILSLPSCRLTMAVGAYYFVITFIGTVGLGDIRTGGHLEYFFENIEALCGSFFFAALTSCFASYFDYADTYGRGAVQAKLSTLASYFRVAHTTKPTSRAILANTKLWCSRTGGLVNAAVTAHLPVAVRVELATFIQRQLLETSRVLTTECDPFLRDKIVLCLHFQVVCSGGKIYDVGENLDEVAFVHDGMVKLIDENGTLLRTGSVGCHVGRGEAGPCLHTVVAVEHVELYVLDTNAKQEVLGHMASVQRMAFLQLLDQMSLHAMDETKLRRDATRRRASELIEEEEVELQDDKDGDDDQEEEQLPSWLPQALFR